MKVIEYDYFEVGFLNVDGCGWHSVAKFTSREDADIFALQNKGGWGDENGIVKARTERIEIFESLEESGITREQIIEKIKEKLKLARLTPGEMALLGIK